MTVPLSAEAFIAADGRQKLRVYRVGGECVVEPSPVSPYFFTDTPMSAGAPALERKALSTLEPSTWFLNRFANEAKMRAASKRYRSNGVRVAEDRLRLVDRILVDEADYFKRFDTGGKPKVMYVDIEQLTDGTRFPEKTDPVIAIAWAIDDGSVHCFAVNDTTEPFEVTRFFDEHLRGHNPDIIVVFNGESYDLPVLASHGVTLSRDGSPPAYSAKTRRTSSGNLETTTIELAGRVVFDVRWSAELDMALSGIADRKLKTIAEWLDLPHVKADASNTAALTPDELRAYCSSDVALLRQIARRYLPDKLALAEYVGAPYDCVLNGGSSFAGSIIAARVNAAAGIVSDGSNESRFAAHIPAGAKFEGATVALHKKGRFAPCWKADYASLYPSLLVALGAGPDNTVLLSSAALDAKALADGWYSEALMLRSNDGVSRVYVVNDLALKRQFEIEVRGRSAFADTIAGMMAERLDVKRQAKASGSAELEARAGMLKIVLNSIYGGMGADHSAHGSKAVAMLVTAGGRAMVAALGSAIGEGDPIETDTDGVYFTGRERTAHQLGVAVNAVALERFAMRPVFSVDVDREPAGYFYKPKSYGLLHDDGSMTWYGGAFKGSVHPALFRRVVDEVGGAILRGERYGELALSARDLTRYAPADFVKRVRWSGNPNSAPGAEVAASFAVAYGRQPTVGERMTYLKTSSGYEVPTAEAYSRIDSKYYLSVVDEALERLGALDAAKPKRTLRSIGRKTNSA